jgi:pimeloyl-ACP methyl ester carboxylesterase
MPAEISPLSRFANNDGVRLHYLDSDPSDRRDPVVFVPGLSDVADDYAPVLAEFGRRTIVIDLRGRGRSDLPEKGFAREHHMADIGAVLRQADVDRFHLATFSRGTAYALPYALSHPARVRSMTIGDYIAGEMSFPGESWPEQFVSGRWRGQPVSERVSLHAIRGIASESVERRYWAELKTLNPHLMVVRAGRAREGAHVFIDETAKADFRRAMPSVEIVSFDDCGHDLFRNDPTRYPRLVAQFIARAEISDKGGSR